MQETIGLLGSQQQPRITSYTWRCHISNQVLSGIRILVKHSVRTARLKRTLEMVRDLCHGTRENPGTGESSTDFQTWEPLLVKAKIPGIRY